MKNTVKSAYQWNVSTVKLPAPARRSKSSTTAFSPRHSVLSLNALQGHGSHGAAPLPQRKSRGFQKETLLRSTGGTGPAQPCRAVGRQRPALRHSSPYSHPLRRSVFPRDAKSQWGSWGERALLTENKNISLALSLKGFFKFSLEMWNCRGTGSRTVVDGQKHHP